MEKKVVGVIERNYFSDDPEMKIYYDILNYNDIKIVFLDINDKNFWQEIRKIDLLIYKWGHDHHSFQVATSILPVIDKDMGIKCFPDWNTCWHYDDKIKQSYLLKANGFPVVDSYIFWRKNSALEWLGSLDNYPIVCKLRNGSGSFSVFLIKNHKKAKKMVNRMFGKGMLQTNTSLLHTCQMLNNNPQKIFRHYAIGYRNRFIHPERRQFWLRHKNYVYFQKYLADNQWDTRVTTAGNRVHAFRRFTRPGDFRASGGNVWDINPDEIDQRMLKIALDISKHFGFQAMAYDFIYNDNKDPQIVEMSYLYGGAGYPDFMNGYWDEDLKWHSGRYWPQYFELCDLLDTNKLKMPSVETTTSYLKAKIIEHK